MLWFRLRRIGGKSYKSRIRVSQIETIGGGLANFGREGAPGGGDGGGEGHGGSQCWVRDS